MPLPLIAVAGASVLVGAVGGYLLNPGSTPDNEVTNTIKTIINNTVSTEFSQRASVNINLAIQNLVLNVISSGDVVINIDQSSSTNVIQTADVVIEVLVDLVQTLAQNADLEQESLFGIQLSQNAVNQLTETQIRNTVSAKVSQFLNVNDIKLIDNVVINVDNSNPGDSGVNDPNSAGNYPANYLAEPTIPPTSGDVTISITQNASNNIQLAAAAAILNDLGIQTDLTQEGTLVSEADPISNFFEGISELFGGTFGTIIIFAIIIIIIIFVAKPSGGSGSQQPIIVYAYPPPQQPRKMESKSQQGNDSEKEEE